MAQQRYESKRKRFEIMRQELHNQRESFIQTWRQVNNFIAPNAGRFYESDVNRGERRDIDIINNTSRMASNTLRAGMMSGITSPARPWFKLGAPDPEMNEYSRVKAWTSTVEKRMNNVFLKSNLYKTLPYRDLGSFGTAPMSVEKNIENIIHTAAYPVGSYYLAKDELGRVNVFYREWQMTVRNIVHMFARRDAAGNIDWSNFSNLVKTCWERGEYETYVLIAHVICPNEDYVPGSPFSKQKRFESCYYERGISKKAGDRNYMDSVDDDKYLRQAGFDYFPILSPRWTVIGEDVYATEYPGETALGDVKQLQHAEMKFGKALDKMVDPTMVLPTALQNQKNSMVPGGFVFADGVNGRNAVHSAYDINLRLDHLQVKSDQIEYRIKRAFYEDLFLMMSQTSRNDITAREIDERHEEKLLALGPVLEQLNQDLLDPLIDITFIYMLERGMLPPPPEELQGQQMRIEYVSMMAQAQRMVGVSVQERFMNTTLGIAAVQPNVWNKVDIYQYIDQYAEDLGVAQGVVRTDEAVAQLEQQIKQQQQAAAMAESAPAMASAAKTLSDTDLGKDSALSALMNR